MFGFHSLVPRSFFLVSRFSLPFSAFPSAEPGLAGERTWVNWDFQRLPLAGVYDNLLTSALDDV